GCAGPVQGFRGPQPGHPAAVEASWPGYACEEVIVASDAKKKGRASGPFSCAAIGQATFDIVTGWSSQQQASLLNLANCQAECASSRTSFHPNPDLPRTRFQSLAICGSTFCHVRPG